MARGFGSGNNRSGPWNTVFFVWQKIAGEWLSIAAFQGIFKANSATF
jgi:hypothetical protein